MEQRTWQILLKIYKDLYTYKHLLKNSPEMTIDVATLSADEIPSDLPIIQQQTQAVIAYLLGVKELPDIPTMSARIDKYYQKDDFWRRLLLSYVDVCQSLENENSDPEIKAQQEQIVSQVKDLSDSVDEYIRKRKEIIARFSAKLDTQNFPIDSKKLFTNYLNMAEKDPENAWILLITSPAAFAPLRSVDASGRVLISPSQAKKINKNIGHFIKALKA